MEKPEVCSGLKVSDTRAGRPRPAPRRSRRALPGSDRRNPRDRTFAPTTGDAGSHGDMAAARQAHQQNQHSSTV